MFRPRGHKCLMAFEPGPVLCHVLFAHTTDVWPSGRQWPPRAELETELQTQVPSFQFPVPSPKQTARVCRHLRHLTISWRRRCVGLCPATETATAGLLSLPSCESGRNDKTVHCSLIGWAWGIFILIYWSGSGESQWAGNRLAFKLWIESELKENLSNQRLPRCQISFFFHKFYFYKFFFFAVSFLPDSVLMAF